MAVTNLTGTTWIFNDSIQVPSELYNINFISNDENFVSISAELSELYYSGIYIYSTKVGWINETYKTISIIGGTDAINANLISWLEANATLQSSSTIESKTINAFRVNGKTVRYVNGKQVRNITVNGVTYTMPTEQTDALAGTWVFNDSISLTSDTDFYIDFSSNGYNCKKMSTEKGIENVLWYNSTVTSVQEIRAYGSLSGWDAEAYKTITITSKLSEVTDGDTLLTWLQANATKTS